MATSRIVLFATILSTAWTFGSVLFTTIVFASNTSAGNHFNINMTRFTGDDCQWGTQLDDGQHVRGINECHPFANATAFGSYLYSWAAHNMWGMDAEKYGICKIHVWEGESCDERYLGALQKANTDDRPGSCAKGFADYDGVPGMPKSVRLECHDKHEWKHVPKEPFYGAPLAHSACMDDEC